MDAVVHSVVRYGLSVPCFGVGVDAALLARWAAVAEIAGWDGFFVWDHLFPFSPGPVDVVDPWITLTAAAASTTTIRLGTLVTPLPRRRPMVVARQTATLDRLSGGRLILGVGIGAEPYEWEYCGEQADPRIRGDMLDEHLGLLDRLWSGAPVHHDGTHYRLAGQEWSAVCYPPPLQQPRIPIWVAGTWPGTRPFARAARWDGVIPMRPDGHWDVEDTAAVAHRLRSLRAGDHHIDVAVPGESDGTDNRRTDQFTQHENAGATWWVESIHPWRYGWNEGHPWPLDAMENRIAQGP